MARMSRFPRALALSSLLAGVALASTPARAHINLLEPVARVPGAPDSQLLLGPCGQRQNERLADRVSVFRAGQSIDMVWDVYVQHVSYFRIAFDPDGDDSFSTRPSAPRDAAADDPTQLEPGDGELILDYILDRTADVDRVERRVTLPDIACDRCTLQLTQFTYGLPLDDAIYYQCADLVLEAAEDDAPAAAGASDAGDPDASGGGSSGCSLAAASTARRAGSGFGGLSWLVPLAALLALGARREKAQGAGSDSIHCRSSST
jgi:hypothetical protein